MSGAVRGTLLSLARPRSALDYVLSIMLFWIVVLIGGWVLDADLGRVVWALIPATVGSSIGMAWRLRSERRKREAEAERRFKQDG